jgi:hypothetical protein
VKKSRLKNLRGGFFVSGGGGGGGGGGAVDAGVEPVPMDDGGAV